MSRILNNFINWSCCFADMGWRDSIGNKLAFV